MQPTIPWDLKDKYKLFLGYGSHFCAQYVLYSKGCNLLTWNKFVLILEFQTIWADCYLSELMFCCAVNGHACVVNKQLPPQLVPI